MNKGILQYGKLKHSWNRLIYIVIIFYLYISVFGRKTKIDRTDISIYIILHKYKCIYKYWILHKWKNLLKNNTKFIVFLISNFAIFIIKKFKKMEFYIWRNENLGIHYETLYIAYVSRETVYMP